MAESAPDPTDRLGGALRRLILLTFPSLRFFAIYEYALIQGTAGPTLQARCTDPGLGMPDLPPTKLFPSVAGATGTWTTPGTKFLVGFVNGDPTRPFVIAGDPSQIPDTVSIPANTSVSLAGGTASLLFANWATNASTGLVKALVTFAGALNTAATFSAIQAAGGALNTALGTLPTAGTSKTGAA